MFARKRVINELVIHPNTNRDHRGGNKTKIVKHEISIETISCIANMAPPPKICLQQKVRNSFSNTQNTTSNTEYHFGEFRHQLSLLCFSGLRHRLSFFCLCELQLQIPALLRRVKTTIPIETAFTIKYLTFFVSKYLNNSQAIVEDKELSKNALKSA